MESRVPTMVKEDPAKFWEALYGTERLALHATIYTWPAEQIPPGWVLDVGCEYGFGSLLIAETNPGVHVAGVDLDLSALRYSRNTLSDDRMLERVNADAFQLPVESESVSGIYLINLLHLLPEPVGIWSEVWRALTPEGVAIISVPRELPPDGGPFGGGCIEQLAAQARVFFAEVECPVEIRGHLPSFPPQSFRLDSMTSPWIALCRKKRKKTCSVIPCSLRR